MPIKLIRCSRLQEGRRRECTDCMGNGAGVCPLMPWTLSYHHGNTLFSARLQLKGRYDQEGKGDTRYGET